MQSVINTSVKLSPELRDRVKQFATIRNQSVHSVMLQAIDWKPFRIMFLY